MKDMTTKPAMGYIETLHQRSNDARYVSICEKVNKAKHALIRERDELESKCNAYDTYVSLCCERGGSYDAFYSFSDSLYDSLRGKIKRVQARLDELDKLDAARVTQTDAIVFAGGEIVKNAELNRLQIIFHEIPDADTRANLKSNGFRWSPSNQAWQRQLTQNAENAARRILGCEGEGGCNA